MFYINNNINYYEKYKFRIMFFNLWFSMFFRNLNRYTFIDIFTKLFKMKYYKILFDNTKVFFNVLSIICYIESII